MTGVVSVWDVVVDFLIYQHDEELIRIGNCNTGVYIVDPPRNIG